MAFTDITSKVKTGRPVLPQIYAYTTPEIARHDGWTKIGYTEQDVETRVKQQTHTANVYYIIQWHGNATYEDTGETFRDTDFHGYLKKLNVTNEPDTEWYEIEPDSAKMPQSNISFAPSRAAPSSRPSTTPSTTSVENTYGTPSRASAKRSRATTSAASWEP